MKINRIEAEYFDWMYSMMCHGSFDENYISFRKLFTLLHMTEFRWSIKKDFNRAEDGRSLRRHFELEVDRYKASKYIEGPCSVLEMMVALAIKIEDLMDDPEYGDRTSQWFWGMIINLGLGGMHNAQFDRKKAIKCIDTFLDRKYKPNGRGGLFMVKNCDLDLRTVEIWYQMQWYLNTIA